MVFPALIFVLKLQDLCFQTALRCVCRVTHLNNVAVKHSIPKILLTSVSSMSMYMFLFDPVVRSQHGPSQPTSLFEALRCFFLFPLLFQILAVIVFVGPESSIVLYKAAVPTAGMFWIAGIWLLLWF